MEHKITSKDSVMLYGDAAWHGLGTVTHERCDAAAAFEKSGLDWEVAFGEKEVSVVGGKVAMQNYYRTLWRSGSHRMALEKFTGVYRPIQNKALFDLGQAIIDLAYWERGEKMFVESCGSVQGGRKVWLLLRRGSRPASEGGAFHEYVVIANSHDGTLRLWVKPTSVRVVCGKTLSTALDSAGESYIAIAHRGCIDSKIAAAKRMLGRYFGASATLSGEGGRLAGKKGFQCACVYWRYFVKGGGIHAT